MDEQQAVTELIDRLVRESNIPSRRARDELRRELASHFEEACRSPEELRAALLRFGSPDVVSDAFRRTYGRRRTLLYVAKVVAAILASTFIALVLQVIVSLRFAIGMEARRLAPWHLLAAVCSILVVLVAVAAWELGIQPLCARLEHRPVRLLSALVVVFGSIMLTHATTRTFIHPSQAFVASAVFLAIWTLTIAIQSRFDLAFLDILERRHR